MTITQECGFRDAAYAPTVTCMAPIPNPGQRPEDKPEAYVGLSADEADKRARAKGWTTVRALPPGAIITMEYRSGRLNFTVTEGTVTRCWSG